MPEEKPVKKEEIKPKMQKWFVVDSHGLGLGEMFGPLDKKEAKKFAEEKFKRNIREVLPLK